MEGDDDENIMEQEHSLNEIADQLPKMDVNCWHANQESHQETSRNEDSSNTVGSIISESTQNQFIEYNVDLATQQQKQNGSTIPQEEKLVLKEMKVRAIPKVMWKDCSDNTTFYIVGNLIVNLNNPIFYTDNPFEYPSNSSVGLRKYRDIKQIINIENKDREGQVVVNQQINIAPLCNFEFLADAMDKRQCNQIGQEFSKLLRAYQGTVEKSQLILKRSLERMKECGIELKELYRMRDEFIKELEPQVTQQNGINIKESFYLQSRCVSELTALEMTLKSFLYSYPLIALLGLNSDQFIHGVSKKGLLTWISQATRTLLSLENLKDQSYKRFEQEPKVLIDPFIFKTIDDLVVYGTAQRYRQKVIYTGQLGYIFEDVPDSIITVTINIDLFALKRILLLRKDYFLETQTHSFTDDFQYSIESQIFLEKYYQNIYKNQLNQQYNMEIQNKQKAFEDSKTCSYRVISNGSGQSNYWNVSN